ncbi:MAG: glycerate kinase [Nitrospirae bacterium]|nr:glycerate kinase [Nitrospirota bacterium]
MQGITNERLATEIFYASLRAVDLYDSVNFYTDIIRSTYQRGNFNRLIVVGFGKAACPMAKAMEDSLMDLIDAAIAITKYGHCEGQGSGIRGQGSKIKMYEAGHPVPDENGLRGTKEIIRLLKDADENTLVICLISGGGSALFVSPYNGISLEEKQKITQLLLRAGANINELNAVRKHISRVKGGRLAGLAYPAKIISLILSDVIGDRLDVIASGPTSPDKTTFNDALRVLEKYGLIERSPHSVLEVLHNGTSGLMPETPKERDIIFERIENIIIGSNRKALEAAKKKAEEHGLQTEIISSEITGEARDVGKWLAKKAIETRDALSVKRHEKICLISGGETTVTVKGNGLGGRNMELALSFAIEIDGIDGITLLSAGTDGTDGPTDAAGAIVDGETVKRARAVGLFPDEYLKNNDSYNFFKKIDGLFITGPTGTNVMDIQIVVIG